MKFGDRFSYISVSIVTLFLALFVGHARAEDTPQPTKLGIHDVFDLASRNNVRSLLASEKRKEAAGSLTSSYSGMLPHILGSALQSRQTRNLAAIGTDDALLGPYNSFDARISLIQNIFDLSSINDLRAAAAGLNKAQTLESVAREESRLEAGLAYLNLLEAEADTKGIESDLRLATAMSKLVSDQYNAGIVNGVDKTRAEAQLSSIRSLSIQSETQRQRAELNLKRTIGISLATPINLIENLQSGRDEPVSLDEAIATANSKRLELKAASEEVKQRKAEHASAWGKQLPSVSANANYGESATQPNRNDEWTYQLGVNLSVPIFDGAATIGDIVQAKSKKKQAEILLNDLRLQVEEEVRLACSMLNQMREGVKSAKDALRLAEKEMDQVHNQFKEGIGDSIALVTAETGLVRARETYTSALAQFQAARLALAYSRGEIEGFEL